MFFNLRTPCLRSSLRSFGSIRGLKTLNISRIQNAKAAKQRLYQQRRSMGGGGGDSMALHVSEFHLTSAKIMTTACWAWMVWRTYQDGAFVFLGIHPFPHDDHGDHGPKFRGDGEYKDTGFDSPAEYVEEEAEE